MTLTVWGGFLAVILLLLGLDLFVLNRKAHIISAREALLMTAMWVAISLCFNVAVYFLYEHHMFGLGVYEAADHAGSAPANLARSLLPHSGWEAAMMFFTGYLVEQMLSMDNMLVIAMILGYFRVPAKLQHRVLFWGIIGAVVLRGAMIVAGSELVHRWGKYVIPAFGIVLLYSAFKLLVMREDEADMERSLIVRSARRVFNVSSQFDGDRFFTRSNGKLFLTPLMLSLLVVDVADVLFAVDSIPAIFGITHDSFLVFSSNCFAILGLRAIYFAIAALIRRFRYIKVSMVFILGYIGVKMIADRWYHVAPATSLLTIAGMLTLGLAASLVFPAEAPLPADRPIDDITRAAERGWKRARRIVILIVGLTVVFIVAPLVGALPGPGGIFVAIGGLALLATEFVWARKLLATMKDKAQKLSGQSPNSQPPKLWKIAAVVAGYAVFVGLLFWAEETWGYLVPKLEKNWYFLALGPGIAVGYWVFMSLKRWFQLRRVAKSGIPGSVAAPVDGTAGGVQQQQRQSTGSAQ